MASICWLQKHLNKAIAFAAVLFLLLAVFAFPSTSDSQESIADLQFLKVGSVQIQADGPVDEAFLLQLIEITPGVDILTISKIRKSIELLYATGNFSNISVDAQKSGDRVNLTFILRLIYRLKFIRVKGPSGPPYGKIKKELQLRKFEAYLPERVLRGREQLLEGLTENGYFKAKVTPDVLLRRSLKRAEVIYQVLPGPPAYVGSVQFSGKLHFEVPTLLSEMKSKPGKRFQPKRFSRDQEKLELLYDKNGFLEHDIKVVKQDMDQSNRIHLVISIDAGRQLLLKTEGYSLSQGKLDELVPVRTEHSYNDDTLEEGKRNLIHFLQTEGHYDAAVMWEKAISEETTLIIYKIEPGPKYNVGEITIRGNDHLPKEKISELIGTKESGLFSKHLVTRQFEEDQQKILSAYRELGFIFARFKGQKIYRKPEGVIDIELEIEEGPQVIVSDIRMSGNQVISLQTFLDSFAQKTGQPLSETKVKTDSRYIVALYSDRGFPKMKLTNKILLSRDRTRAVLEYSVEEGEQIFVDRIVIGGNYRTKRKIIERSLLFEEDDPLSIQKIAATQSKLYSLDIFDRVEIDLPRPDNLQKYQPVVIHLTESKPFTASYGIGFESYNKLHGVFSLSNRNWRGTDRGIGLQGRGGFQEGRGLLNYNDPHLLNTDLILNVNAIAENRAPRDTFSFRRYALTFLFEKKLSADPARLEVGKPTPPLSSLFFGYEFEDIDTTGTPSLSPEERRFLAIHVSSVNGSYVFDRRDNQIDPHSGQFLSTAVQFATNVLGSETDFIKWFNQFQHYTPVGRSVIATSFRIGLARGFVDTVELPLSLRFFAGGGRTIRGFELDTAGPLDENGEPLGGNAVFIMNLEYRFPLFSSLGAVVFFDYGSAFELVSDMTLSEMRKTMGIGLRYHTPIGPLTLDWGYKLDRRFSPIRESPSEFFLSVGHAF
jgi:outer membrane protein assembly complex protein YaeT